MRKKYMSSLDHRSAEQVAEEEALYIEIKRLEQNERKFIKEREDLLRTLAGVDSGLTNLGLDDDMGSVGVSASSSLDPKKKKKQTLTTDGTESPGAGSSQSPSTPITPITRKAHGAKSAAHGEFFGCISRHWLTVRIVMSDTFKMACIVFIGRTLSQPFLPHIGVRGNLNCRQDTIGGSEVFKESEAGYEELFHPGSPRTVEKQCGVFDTSSGLLVRAWEVKRQLMRVQEALA